MIARYEIVQTARQYLGTPYHHCGRLKGVGIDCIGLVRCVGQELGLPGSNHDLKGYSRQPDGVTLEREFGKVLEKISPEEALVGDVLVFWMTKRQLITHAAFKSPKGIIHTHMGVGRVVEHGLDEKWLKRIGGAYRFKDVEPFYAEPSTVVEMPEQSRVRDCCN